jgi:hypothetical protein
MLPFDFERFHSIGCERNIRTEWLYLLNSFGGVGLLSLSTETTISRVNMFMQQMLCASMEASQLEIGCI